MAGQSWAGIETVHTHCSQWTHTHTRPADCKFLFNECWFPMSCRGRSGGRGEGRGDFRGVHKLLKVWRNQKFFKSFLWYINMKAKPVRDERWDEMSWATWPGRHTSEKGDGFRKRNFVKLEINLRFVCCRSSTALLLLLWQLWRLQVGNQFFFCVHFVLLLFLLHLAIWLWPGV